MPPAHALLLLGLALTLGPPPAHAAPEFDEAMDAFVEGAMEAFEVVPGLGVCVVKGSDVLYLRGFGLRDVEAGLPVTRDTGFYIASSTKSFTGMAASVLAARGELDLDAPVTRHVPNLTLPEPLNPDDMSIRACLTHTTGVNNREVQRVLAFERSLTADEFLDMLLAKSSPMPTDFIYSNLGYNVVGYVLEAATGKRWQEVVTKTVLEPVGMTSTTTSIEAAATGELAWPYEPAGDAFRRATIKSDDIMHAAGGLVTTPADLSRWLIANLNGGRIDGGEALSAEAVTAAHEKHVSTDRDYYRFHRNGYGLGWYHADFEGELLMHHFGGYGGYHAHVSFMPEHGIGVATLLNGDRHRASVLAHVVAGYAYERLLEHPGVDAEYDAEVTRLAARTHADRAFEDQLAEARRLEASGDPAGAAAIVRDALPVAEAADVVSANGVNRLGYSLLEADAVAAAIAAFEYNVGNHPESANAHDSLGEACERAGKLQEAHTHYARACELAASDDRNFDTFHANLERITARLAER